MRKALKNIISFVIVFVTAITLFSAFSTRVQSAGNNNNDSDSSTHNSTGTATSLVFMYKVSVYYDPSNRASKTSDVSNFQVKTKYFGNFYTNEDRQSKGLYVGDKSKFEYLDNRKVTRKLFNTNDLIVESVPKVDLSEDLIDETVAIENYFAGPNEENCYKYVKKIDPNIAENSSWILVVEPIVRTYDPDKDSIIKYFTPTEYALETESGKYDVFNTMKDDVRRSSAIYALIKPGSLDYMDDGTWLGAGTDTDVDNRWKDIGKFDTDKWADVADYYIRHAGVFMWFSDYYKNSDYTLGTTAENSDCYENQTITITSNITRTNAGKEGHVSVTLEYDAEGSQIIGDETQYLTFGVGESSKTVTWQLQVGVYGDYSDRREFEYRTIVEMEDDNVDNNLEDNEMRGTIRLKRDFRVTAVRLNKDECFENEIVDVAFSVKNANPYRDYYDLTVSVFFVDALGNISRIGDVEIGTFERNAEKNGTCKINVGCVTENADQLDSVIVTINAYNPDVTDSKSYTEPDLSNNRGVVTITVKRDINLSVSLVDPNTDQYYGNAPSKVENTDSTQAVTTCVVTNLSRFNLYRGDKMNDTITVTFYVNNTAVESKEIDVPRYGSNLVWFKWDIPSGQSVTLKAVVEWNVDQENSSDPYSDNASLIDQPISSMGEYETPDTENNRDPSADDNYFDAYGYRVTQPSVAKWSQWICDENGVFTRIDYAMTGDSLTTLTPMASAQFYNGSTIMSGSGFSAIFSYTVRTECSEAGYDVSTDDYTYAQNVIATFPEFQYKNTGNCRTMYLVEAGDLSTGKFQFEINTNHDINQRVHYTPDNYDDGEYKMGVIASEMWTPAGMIYVNGASSLMINDAAHNDYAVNADVKES